jgi:hypothetical protein
MMGEPEPAQIPDALGRSWRHRMWFVDGRHDVPLIKPT